MKKTFFFTLLILISSSLAAQSISSEVVANAGNSYQSTTIQLDWTLGEFATPSIQTSNELITQGFHQPIILPLRILVKAYLQGVFNETDMGTGLISSNLLPLSNPYGTSETIITLPANVVDWVQVEVRDPMDSSNILATRTVFLRKDGQILDLDGTLGVVFPNLGVSCGFIAIHHRNHLAVMTNNAVDF